MLIKLCAYLLIAYVSTIAAKEPPVLMDLTVTGSMDSPGFEPLQLSFHTTQEYVLVITNDKPYSVVFNYQKFGQQVSTYLLQGTPNVNQESVTLMPNSKVTWHFIPQKEGQFTFYASIPGVNQKGKAGDIVIKELSLVSPEPSSSDQQHVQVKNLEEVADKSQKKNLFSFLKKKATDQVLSPPTSSRV